MTPKNPPGKTQGWKALGTIQPNTNEWKRFPTLATSGNDLVRVKFIYPDNVYITGWIWLRCRYELNSGVLVTQSRRIYSKPELTGIDFPILADLRELKLTDRVFECKRGERRPRNGISRVPYQWSVLLEELLD
jgi:hypothetical protein